ncbi:Acyl-coenzyme A thioesterase 13 [Choanephora cucurbitarum]|uniref:Acyl-coenzyme A thioesterase 13 n=1 Tax=Choanephora cucurbitarum TaxID=101091 RepID=A0A1C7N872_9FUNG|nr:Acyl-coenzyme A thioesterase 13 [Choanephora cucurbitarum]
MRSSEEITDKYPKLEAYIRSFLKKVKDDPTYWDSPIASALSLVSAEPNKITWKFVVGRSHSNIMGQLHGGCIATLIDICSSFAVLVTTDKYKWDMLVSSDLAVTYTNGVAVGEVLRIECEAQRVGKHLANIYTKIYDQQNRICYSGSNTKFNLSSKL